jgi:hypothetical protein
MPSPSGAGGKGQARPWSFKPNVNLCSGEPNRTDRDLPATPHGAGHSFPRGAIYHLTATWRMVEVLRGCQQSCQAAGRRRVGGGAARWCSG